MSQRSDDRIDAYIAKAPDFAKPVMDAVRRAAQDAHPGVTETIKWSVPFFEYKGSICGISSHKEHCNFVVPKGELIPDLQQWISESTEEGPGTVGRVTSAEQLPAHDRLVAILRLAVELNERGVKAPKGPPKPAPEPVSMPDCLVSALEDSETVRAGWDGLTAARQREYIVWLDDAKTDATKQKRLAQACEWIAEGKGRNWKYESRNSR